jgi:hypothetical protein
MSTDGEMFESGSLDNAKWERKEKKSSNSQLKEYNKN